VRFSPFYRFCQSLFFWVYAPLVIIYNAIVFGLEIEGRENLKHASQTGCILLSNHSLYLDPAVIINTLFPRRAYYFALKSHFHHPLGGFLIRLMGGIPIPDVHEMRRAERTAGDVLDRGHCVHFFPEGVMAHMSQEVAPFQSGAFFMALRLGAPMVPMTLIHRPRRLFGKPISKHFIRVKCVVGEAVQPQQREGETIRQAAERMAAEAHKTMAETLSAGQCAM
jgi:1-acyl-sn-glycerol-3-phosphate acyltransferase